MMARLNLNWAIWIFMLCEMLAQCVDAAVKQPNIVFVVTDDQDVVLGGASDKPLPRVEKALREAGATINNWFVHTPVCCPSRSEILTGRYYHNLAFVPGPENPWDTRDGVHAKQCMHIDESRLSPGPTFAEHLATAGYRVGFFGKYLNISPRRAPTGAHTYFVNPGPNHSPLDPSGEYYPAYWYHVTPTVNETFYFNNTPQDRWYETAFIGNTTTQWIRDNAAAGPFFAYIAPHSPHGMSIPAPWYDTKFPNETAPITPSWNYSATDHHWLVAQQPPVTLDEVENSNKKYQQRWECLLSVDDLITALRATLADLDILKSTYFIYTSDHGFHFQELRLGIGKWNVYDTDVRVHMFISGPGIKPNSTLDAVASHVDLSPTFLGLAGLPTPSVTMDGRSVVPLVIDAAVLREHPESVPLSVRKHVASEVAARQASLTQRNGIIPAIRRPSDAAYIEYHGLGPVGAPARLLDSLNNTYRALRIITPNRTVGAGIQYDARTGSVTGNLLYAEFGGDFLFHTTVFYEVYDLDKDPWQMHNIYNSTRSDALGALRHMTHSLWGCEGDACRA
eukprot:m.86558 g.86558  ORF g.86558 m.86558 type:complete len:564 (+) comp16374_c1_seq19:3474-5165(+)